jgi:Mg2+ and Co2+ transporter CorA
MMAESVECFEISDQLQLTACEYERAVGAVRNRNARIWFHMRGVDPSDHQGILDMLDVKGLARRLVLESRDRPGFYPLKGLTFLVMPVHPAEYSHRAVGHLAFLFQKGFLLTSYDTLATNRALGATLQDSAAWLPENTVTGLISAFMIGLSLESLGRTAGLTDVIKGLEERMDSKPTSVETSELSRRRSELLDLETVVRGQLPILESLLATERTSTETANTREYLVCALANLQASTRTLEWLQGRMDVVRSLVDLRAQDVMNRRLGRLTIFSVIFMPITLLAGIWGMNFESMPELGLPLGYPMALGSMSLLGVGMYFYFRRRGWFD